MEEHMGRRNTVHSFTVSEPITLDDLRWLVEQTQGLAGKSEVTTKEHRSIDAREWDEASITVNGEPLI
jgi:hypothetical protein